jgi:hypothetical protein
MSGEAMNEWNFYRAGDVIQFDDPGRMTIPVLEDGWYCLLSLNGGVQLLRASKPSFWERLQHRVTRKPWPKPSEVLTEHFKRAYRTP